MKNLRFLLKCILVLIPFIAVMLVTALFPLGYMDIEYPAWKYTYDVSFGNNGTQNKTDNAESGGTTVILGDSRAMADLIPDELDNGGVTYNLAVGGATPIEMYYTMKRYIENNGTPEKAVIMFAPFHYSIIDNYTSRTEYFNFLTLSEWIDLTGNARSCAADSVIYDGYFNAMLSYRLRFPDKYLPALVNARVFTRYSENKSEYDDIVLSRGYGSFGNADGCSDLNFETTYDYMHITGDAVLIQLYMNKLLKLLSDNNIDTLVALPPMNKSSFDALKPSYVEDFTDYLSDLERLFPDINFDKTIPCMDDAYFGDSSHLNKTGARIFSGQFAKTH